jgi:predicted RNA-binding Zn-ribbon protein involved in translation (DUF1610 family)
MTDHDTDMEPARCGKCHEVVTVDYHNAHPTCPLCRDKVHFYTDPSLQKKPDNPENDTSCIRLGDFLMTNVNYLCPSCGEMKMKFYDAGCWD